MKNTVKRISILASAFVMATSSFIADYKANAEKSVDLTSGYAAETINLSDAEAIAGNQVMVQLSLNTGNTCEGYNLDIEFDSSLTLVNVEGAIAWDVIDNVVTIIGFSGIAFEDGKSLASLYFETPETASEGVSYNIGVTKSELTCENDVIQNAEVKNSTVEVIESAKDVTNYVVRKDNTIGLRGDANEDGRVDLQDAIAIAKYMIGNEKLSVNGTYQADVNENNKVELQDVIAVSKYMMVADKDNAWSCILNK